MKGNKDKLENEHKDNKKRKIEFRGKAKNKKCWVVGDLIHCENGYSIIEKKGGCIKVKPETIGQFTGLCDKNGKKIYEGDVVKSHYGSIYFVKYFDYWGSFSLKLVFLNTEGKLSRATGRQHLYKNDCTRLEIVGNVWDNPELLGGSDEECDN